MANGAVTTALERLLKPLSREMTADLARMLLNIQADEDTQARYEELAEKHSAAIATPEELAELEGLVQANTFLGVLRAEARAFLGKTPHA
ncbi:MAG: hypothetical protein L0Y58_12745 [Verrucomicrobia subdivision 3 bacterium]|nr:hypothetical protein [Limisphaerales bacterium]